MTPFKLRRSVAPLILVVGLFLVQVLFYLVLSFERVSWQDDGRGPFNATSEWVPHRTYSPTIERAIAALSQSDPDKVQYLRQHGLPIHVLTGPQMALSGCPAGSLGCTRFADSSINVLDRAAASPLWLAVVLSHELTHCRSHDVQSLKPAAGLWERLLWRNEEAQAHVAGLATAWRLRLPFFSGPLTGWYLEYLVWYWPAGSLFLSGIASLLGVYLILRYIARHPEHRTGQPSSFRQQAVTEAIL